MPDEKKIVNYRLSEKSTRYISTVAANYGTTKTQALEMILSEHEAQAADGHKAMANEIMDEFDRRYGNQLTHIRLNTNYTDKNVQTMIEVFNTILFAFKLTAPCPTSKVRNAVLDGCEEEVTRRIARYKQINDERTKKKRT